MNGSSKFTISNEELQRWFHNSVTFFAFPALLYFSSVNQNIGADGLALQDFIPNQVTTTAIALHMVNMAIDFFRKWAPNTNGKPTYRWSVTSAPPETPQRVTGEATGIIAVQEGEV